jgi:CheY-like chemotaxis protein
MDNVPFNEEPYRSKFRDYLRRKREFGRPADSHNLIIAQTIGPLGEKLPRPASPALRIASDSELDANAFPPLPLSVSERTLKNQCLKSDNDSDPGLPALAPPELRKLMEDAARKSKRSGEPCPYCNPRNMCIRPYIRCGERMQFSTRESIDQRIQPHRCNYDLTCGGSNVLVVAESKTVRDFLTNSLVMFLYLDPGNIHAASSGPEAIVILNRCKLENKRCRLVISDISMQGLNGFELVNEIFARNWETNIVLLNDKNTTVPKPARYAGDIEIVPGEPLVKAIVQKPFHSNEIVTIASSLL